MSRNRPDRDRSGRFKSRTKSDAGHRAHESIIGTTIRLIYWWLYDLWRWIKP